MSIPWVKRILFEKLVIFENNNKYIYSSLKINNFIQLLKYVLIGIVLLFLFHFESLSIGPLRISHLWKGTLLIFLLFSVLRKKRVNYFIYKPLLGIAFLQLLNLEFYFNPFNSLFLFGTSLILCLVGIFVLNYNSRQLRKGLLFFSSFFILSFLPYKLNLLTSLEEGYDLSKWGGDGIGLVGPFQNVHSASTALAGAFLVILYFWLSREFNRLYLSILLVLGFYFLIGTYARTGLAMVALGAIPILIYFAKKDISARLRLFFLGGLLGFLIVAWVISDQAFLDRVTGSRLRSEESDSFQNLGSGRGGIYLAALEIYIEASVYEKIMGMGMTVEKNRMEIKMGASFIPHNGFLLLLINNGLIGFILFISFLYNLFKYQKQVHPKKRALLYGLFISYTVMSFFQNFDLLYMYLILVLSVAYAYRTRSFKVKSINKITEPLQNFHKELK